MGEHDIEYLSLYYLSLYAVWALKHYIDWTKSFQGHLNNPHLADPVFVHCNPSITDILSGC